MKDAGQKVAGNVKHVWIPILIGLSVVGIILWNEFDPSDFDTLIIDIQFYAGLSAALVFFVIQFMLMTYRFRLLSSEQLSMKQSFEVNSLVEFTSAVTPGIVGGSTLLIWFLNREGLNMGKSTAITITCLFLDELFFSLSCGVILLFTTLDDLFSNTPVLYSGISIVFFSLYVVIVLYTVMLYISLFVKPSWTAKVLLLVFSLPGLRKWKHNIEILNKDLEICAREMKQKSFAFWMQAFMISAVSWIFRYMIVNAILFAFNTGGNQLLALARQFVLWILMIVSPTPGGSGLSEYMFKVYYADYFSSSSIALMAGVCWRFFSYYTNLIIGVFIIPAWLRRKKQTSITEKL